MCGHVLCVAMCIHHGNDRQHQLHMIKNISACCIDPRRYDHIVQRQILTEAYSEVCCLNVVNFFLVCDPCRTRSVSHVRASFVKVTVW